MSQENVEIARRAYEAFGRGDFEAFAALLHPEVEFESLILEMEAGSYRGLEVRGSNPLGRASLFVRNAA